jgi:DNA-binding PadR family transcriptional regulator
MAVLLLLTDEPMHPYGLRQRLLEWDKDRVINVGQRHLIYQTINRLERDSLVEILETTRRDKRPERTVYLATERGVTIAMQWLRDMLADPATEYPRFPAALAFLGSLTAEASLDALHTRVSALETAIGRLDKEVADRVAQVPGGVERIYLLEIEYQHSMWQAELAWVRELINYLGERNESSRDREALHPGGAP